MQEWSSQKRPVHSRMDAFLMSLLPYCSKFMYFVSGVIPLCHLFPCEGYLYSLLYKKLSCRVSGTEGLLDTGAVSSSLSAHPEFRS